MLAGETCLPQGNCTKTNFVGEYELYDKTYNLDESIQLRALSVLAAKMLNGQYMTIQPDVKAGGEGIPLWRDDYDIEYQSEATGGRGAKDCGPFDPSGNVMNITNKRLKTYYMYNEVSLCYKKLIGTFLQDLLNKGAMLAEENTALNDRLLKKMIEKNNIQTDTLIWHGDFKSPKKFIAHYDGIVKKVAKAIANTNAHKISLVFAGIVSGDCVEGRVGGQTFKITFDTNMATTLTAFAAEIASYTDPITGEALYTVAFNGTTTVTVTTNVQNVKIDLVVGVTACDGMDSCDLPNTAGTGTVTRTEVDAYKWSDEPMLIDYTPITTGNVIAEINKIYLKIAETKPQLLSNPNFHIHVSSHVWAAYLSASTQLTGGFLGINNIPEAKPFNLRIVEQPYLFGNLIIGAARENIFFGTDLLSDMGNADQWIDKDCQEVRFRNEVAQGVQIDRLDEIVANLKDHPFTFQASQPEVVGFPKNV